MKSNPCVKPADSKWFNLMLILVGLAFPFLAFSSSKEAKINLSPSSSSEPVSKKAQANQKKNQKRDGYRGRVISEDNYEYGGQNGGLIFIEKSEIIVQKLMAKLQEQVNSRADIQANFENLLKELGAQRKRLAQTTKSKHADSFGAYRPEGNIPSYCGTPLIDQKFSRNLVAPEFRASARERFVEYLNHFSGREKKESIEIISDSEVRVRMTILKEDWDEVFLHDSGQITWNGTLLPVDGVRLDLDTVSAITHHYRVHLTQRMRALINTPQFYSAYMILDFYLPFDKSLPYTRAVSYIALFPMDDSRPNGVSEESIENFKNLQLTFLCMHMKREDVKKWIPKLASLWEEAVLWDKNSPRTLQSIMGEFHYYFSFVMPYLRGSAAINQWMGRAIYNFHGFEAQLPEWQSIDLVALAMPRVSDFIKSYTEGLKLTPIESTVNSM